MSDIDDLAEARARLRDKGGAWRAQLLLSVTKDPRLAERCFMQGSPG